VSRGGLALGVVVVSACSSSCIPVRAFRSAVRAEHPGLAVAASGAGSPRARSEAAALFGAPAALGRKLRVSQVDAGRRGGRIGGASLWQGRWRPRQPAAGAGTCRAAYGR